jgi:hypothetical protein
LPSFAGILLPTASESAEFWSFAQSPQFVCRRLFDVRTALVLIACGVDEFATANLKEFQGLGFKKVWNPLED